jgi:hypothetical protein
LTAYTAKLAGPEVFAEPEVAALYGERAEGPAFYLALGRGNAAEMGSVVVYDGERPVAAGVTYSLSFDTTTSAPKIAPAVALVRKLFPNAGRLRIAGLGAVQSGECGLAMAGTLTPAERDRALLAMVEAVEAFGTQSRANMLWLMDFSDTEEWIPPVLAKAGYLRTEAVPKAWMHLPYTSMDEYLAARSHNFRKSLRKNIGEALARLEVTRTNSLTGIGSEIDALALSTHEHAQVKFGGIEVMPPGFYNKLAELAPEVTATLLYRRGNQLVGFGFMIAEQAAIMAKTVGLLYPEASELKLVHFNLYQMIAFTIAEGKPWLRLGQAGFRTKLKFGAKLVRRSSFVKGRGIMKAMLAMGSKKQDQSSPARRWPETSDAANYFDAHPGLAQPPVKPIWAPE